ncbi:hypothetical protein D3C78_1244530 [compost metagenome]
MRRIQQLRQRGVVHFTGQVITHQTESLLTAQTVALQEAKELMHVGHGSPFSIHFFSIG